MVDYNKVNDFVEDMAKGVHDFTSAGTGALTAALTNTAITATDGQLSDLTSVVTTNLSTTAFTYTTTTQSPAGTYLLLLADLVLTASGAVADFRYVGYYNNTATNDEMVGWWDYGSTVTGMASPDTFTIDFTTSTFTLV